MKKILYTSMFLAPFFLSAQETAIKDSSGAYNLNEVLISGNRIEEPRRALSQQVEKISATEIRNWNLQNTADVLQNTGLVAVQKSQQGGGSPMIRGFEASRVLLVVDGVRMNNLIYRAGHLQNVMTTDPNSMERLEILFGPSSTVYGSDALGGVVHMYTKNPILSTEKGKLATKGNIFFRYASAGNEKTAHFDISLGGTKIASFTSINFSDFGNLRMGREKNPFYEDFGDRNFYVRRYDNRDSLLSNRNPLIQNFSAYHQYDIIQKLLIKQNEKVSHLFNVQFSNSSNVPRYDRLTDPKGSGLSYAEWYYGPQKRFMAAYNMEYNNEGGAIDRIFINLNYQNIEETRHTRRFGSDSRSDRYEYVNVYGYTIDLEKVIKSHHIRFGIDGQFNTLRSRASKYNLLTGAYSALDTRYPDGNNYMNNIAFYLTHNCKIGEKLVLNDGIRIGYSQLHSTINDTTFFKFPFSSIDQKNFVVSGNIGLVWLPSKRWKNTLNFSTGYRVPNIDDLSKIFETAAGSVIVPNNKLKPEKTLNLDLGITKFFGDHVRWENTFFGTYMIDAIMTYAFKYQGQDSITYDGVKSQVLANQNKGKAFILGFSSQLFVDIGKGFYAYGGITYTYGRVLNGSTTSPLDHIPPAFGKIGVRYSQKKWYGEIYSVYNGWKRINHYYLNGEDNEQYATKDGMPAWFILNLKASYQVLPYLQLQAGVDNIADTKYRTFASGINAPGRNIYGTLRCTF